MGNLKITPKLKGNFGEICYEEFADKNNYAYLHSKEIWRLMPTPNTYPFSFRHKYELINVTLPFEALNEVFALTRPSNRNVRAPSFVYDYLTVSLKNFEYEDNYHSRQMPVSISDLAWAEVKYGKGTLTKNQQDIFNNTNIPVSVFHVKSSFPKEITINLIRK